jgi:hypothetical protein
MAERRVETYIGKEALDPERWPSSGNGAKIEKRPDGCTHQAQSPSEKTEEEGSPLN